MMRWLLNRRLGLQSTWVGLAALALLGLPGAARRRRNRGARGLEDRHRRLVARRTDRPHAARPLASRPRTGCSWAAPRSCAPRSSPARSTSIPSTPATARSSSPTRRTRPGRTTTAGYARVKALDSEKQQAGLAAALAGQQHLGHRRAQGRGAQPEAEHAGRPGPLGRRRRQVQARGVGRVRRAPRCLARVPGRLRLQAQAGPAADAGRRRHRGHHQGRGRADLGRQRRHGLWHRRPGGRARAW